MCPGMFLSKLVYSTAYHIIVLQKSNPSNLLLQKVIPQVFRKTAQHLIHQMFEEPVAHRSLIRLTRMRGKVPQMESVARQIGDRVLDGFLYEMRATCTHGQLGRAFDEFEHDQARPKRVPEDVGCGLVRFRLEEVAEASDDAVKLGVRLRTPVARVELVREVFAQVERVGGA